MIICSSPSYAFFWNEPSWSYVRDFYLGPGSAELNQLCNIARRRNAVGISYWEPNDVAMKKKELGENHVAGQTAAMNRRCPDVW